MGISDYSAISLRILKAIEELDKTQDRYNFYNPYSSEIRQIQKEMVKLNAKIQEDSIKSLDIQEDNEKKRKKEDEQQVEESGISRSKIRSILDIIRELTEKNKEVDIKEIYAKSELSINDVNEIIEKLKSEGLLFYPCPNFVQKV